MVNGRHGVYAFVNDPHATEIAGSEPAFASLADCKALASKIREAEIETFRDPAPRVSAVDHPNLCSDRRAIVTLAGLKSFAAIVEAIASGSDGDDGGEPAVTVGVAENGTLFAFRTFATTGEVAVVLLAGEKLHGGGVPSVFPCAPETGKVVFPSALGS